MNRDPENKDCTRDPIYLLQVGIPQWTAIPDGFENDGESWVVEDLDDVDDWALPFLDADNEYINRDSDFTAEAEKYENSYGWPLVYIEWRTETVFLTRQEAEDWARARAYRWNRWRVYCVPCEGELARLLNEAEAM